MISVIGRQRDDNQLVRVKGSNNDSTKKTQSVARYSLGLLLAIVALNAFGGGYYGMSGAEGVPTEWLTKTPFQDYFIPGLILFIVVGGSFLFAATAVFAGWQVAKIATLSAVAIVFIWLLVQVAIIGYVSWMQPATAIVAVIIFVIALLRPEITDRGT